MVLSRPETAQRGMRKWELPILGLFLKVSICRDDIDFFARQGDLTQESFVDFKENQRNIAEQDTSFGVLHTFQKRPNKETSVERIECGH